MARLQERYNNEVTGALMSKFGYKSVMQIPKLEKVVINVACGEARDNPKVIEAIVGDLGKLRDLHNTLVTELGHHSAGYFVIVTFL